MNPIDPNDPFGLSQFDSNLACMDFSMNESNEPGMDMSFNSPNALDQVELDLEALIKSGDFPNYGVSDTGFIQPTTTALFNETQAAVSAGPSMGVPSASFNGSVNNTHYSGGAVDLANPANNGMTTSDGQVTGNQGTGYQFSGQGHQLNGQSMSMQTPQFVTPGQGYQLNGSTMQRTPQFVTPVSNHDYTGSTSQATGSSPSSLVSSARSSWSDASGASSSKASTSKVSKVSPRVSPAGQQMNDGQQPMMRLPRALDNADYANHVSPMVPARGGGSISPTVNQARRRIDSLAQQRAQNHQTLTSGVSKRQKSKTVKQLLAENESLQRFNAMQHQRIKSMEAQAKANKSQYLLLVDTHNRVLKELHKVQHESNNKNKN